jgi:hypothetical protein
MLSAEGVATADNYQADKLDNAAKYGELKAVQTGGQMTRSLNNILGNISAVRAAARADPNSPTGIAISDNAAVIGNDQKNITVNSILQQSRQDTADAKYYRLAADHALLAGGVGAAAGIAKGLAGLSFGGGKAPGGSSIGDPTQIGSLY